MYFFHLSIFFLALFYFIYDWFNTFSWSGLGVFVVALVYTTTPYLLKKRKKEKNSKKKNKSKDVSSDQIYLLAIFYFLVFLFLLGKLDWLPAFGLTSMTMIASGLIIYTLMIILYYVNKPMERPIFNTMRLSLLFFTLLVLLIIFYYKNLEAS